MIKSTTRGLNALHLYLKFLTYEIVFLGDQSLFIALGEGRGGFRLFLPTIDPIRNRNLRSQAPKGGKRGGRRGQWMNGKKGTPNFL